MEQLPDPPPSPDIPIFVHGQPFLANWSNTVIHMYYDERWLPLFHVEAHLGSVALREFSKTSITALLRGESFPLHLDPYPSEDVIGDFLKQQADRLSQWLDTQ